jgi:hypothetical protein
MVNVAGWYEDDWFKRQSYLDEEKIECTRDQMIQVF